VKDRGGAESADQASANYLHSTLRGRSLNLRERPSGYVIWIVVSPELELQSVLWFGGLPGEPLPDIGNMKVAKHPKGNAQGTKAERPNHRVVRRSQFERLDTLDGVLDKLFGAAVIKLLI
jgi:hypothetical protein